MDPTLEKFFEQVVKEEKISPPQPIQKPSLSFLQETPTSPLKPKLTIKQKQQLPKQIQIDTSFEAFLKEFLEKTDQPKEGRAVPRRRSIMDSPDIHTLTNLIAEAQEDYVDGHK